MASINNQILILLHVIMASFLSGVIGYERGKTHKPAGVRTNMLIGGAVSLLVMQGEIIIEHYQYLGLSEFISADPIRMIQSIVIGISFIGAGMVMQIEQSEKVKYLTSSATILFSAGLGISVALRQYVLAIGITIFILFINSILAHTWFKRKEME
jgi:putative Mg2+ transporter-C (MgtC) family protein